MNQRLYGMKGDTRNMFRKLLGYVKQYKKPALLTPTFALRHRDAD